MTNLAFVLGLGIFVFIFGTLFKHFENLHAKLITTFPIMGFLWVIYGLMLQMAEEMGSSAELQSTLLAGYTLMTYTFVAIMILIFCYFVYTLMMKLVRVSKESDAFRR